MVRAGLGAVPENHRGAPVLTALLYRRCRPAGREPTSLCSGGAVEPGLAPVAAGA